MFNENLKIQIFWIDEVLNLISKCNISYDYQVY